MTVSLADLPMGHEFEATRLKLSPEWVREYAAAVEDGVTMPDVPPLALTTLSFRALLDQMALPEGTIHVGQELSFSGWGEQPRTLVAAARIASRGERQGWVLMGLEMTIDDESGTPMMSGRATITFPTTGRSREPRA